MSTHFIHKYKHSHDIRRRFFKALIKNGNAVVIEKCKHGFLVESINGVNYRISRRGRVLKNER